MIEINNLCKTFNSFQGPVQALKNVSFSVKEGELTIISGENGSGKSVLASILAGLEKADSGNFSTGGKVGLVFQEAETQILGETPQEDIAFGLENLKYTKSEIKKIAEDILEKTGLSKKAAFPARFLSGGEKRRLAIACMIALQRPILILDEPYANLDYSGVLQVNDLIKKLKAEGKTILLVTHEIEKCINFSDNFIVLFRGEKIFQGTCQEALQAPLEKWNIKNPLTSYR